MRGNGPGNHHCVRRDQRDRGDGVKHDPSWDQRGAAGLSAGAFRVVYVYVPGGIQLLCSIRLWPGGAYDADHGAAIGSGGRRAAGGLRGFPAGRRVYQRNRAHLRRAFGGVGGGEAGMGPVGQVPDQVPGAVVRDVLGYGNFGGAGGIVVNIENLKI